MKEQKRSQKSLQSTRKTLPDSKDGSHQPQKHEINAQTKINPKKMMMLSDLLNRKSTQGTEEAEQVVNSKAEKLSMTNKFLKNNLNNIFKSTRAVNQDPSILQKNIQFKIGKSQESSHQRNTNTSLGGSSKALSKDISRMRTENLVSKAGSRKSLKVDQVDKKKSEKPPVPKTKKPVIQNTEFYLSRQDMNDQAFKVNVNVEITSTRPQVSLKPAKVPPKAPISKRSDIQPQQLTKKQTNLIRQNVSSQPELVLPKLPARSSQLSRLSERSNQSDHSLQNQIAGRRPSQEAGQRKSFIQVKKSQTEASVIEMCEGAVYIIEDKPSLVHQNVNLSPTDQLLVEHQQFQLSRRTPAIQKKRRQNSQEPVCISYSQLSTPCIILDNSKDQASANTPICLFRRRNSDECMSSNSKNKIKWFLSDQVTRVLFEKVYKKQLQIQLDSSLLS